MSTWASGASRSGGVVGAIVPPKKKKEEFPLMRYVQNNCHFDQYGDLSSEEDVSALKAANDRRVNEALERARHECNSRDSSDVEETIPDHQKALGMIPKIEWEQNQNDKWKFSNPSTSRQKDENISNLKALQKEASKEYFSGTRKSKSKERKRNRSNEVVVLDDGFFKEDTVSRSKGAPPGVIVRVPSTGLPFTPAPPPSTTNNPWMQRSGAALFSNVESRTLVAYGVTVENEEEALALAIAESIRTASEERQYRIDMGFTMDVSLLPKRTPATTATLPAEMHQPDPSGIKWNDEFKAEDWGDVDNLPPKVKNTHDEFSLNSEKPLEFIENSHCSIAKVVPRQNTNSVAKHPPPRPSVGQEEPPKQKTLSTTHSWEETDTRQLEDVVSQPPHKVPDEPLPPREHVRCARFRFADPLIENAQKKADATISKNNQWAYPNKEPVQNVVSSSFDRSVTGQGLPLKSHSVPSAVQNEKTSLIAFERKSSSAEKRASGNEKNSQDKKVSGICEKKKSETECKASTALAGKIPEPGQAIHSSVHHRGFEKVAPSFPSSIGSGREASDCEVQPSVGTSRESDKLSYRLENRIAARMASLSINGSTGSVQHDLPSKEAARDKPTRMPNSLPVAALKAGCIKPKGEPSGMKSKPELEVCDATSEAQQFLKFENPAGESIKAESSFSAQDFSQPLAANSIEGIDPAKLAGFPNSSTCQPDLMNMYAMHLMMQAAGGPVLPNLNLGGIPQMMPEAPQVSPPLHEASLASNQLSMQMASQMAPPMMSPFAAPVSPSVSADFATNMAYQFMLQQQQLQAMACMLPFAQSQAGQASSDMLQDMVHRGSLSQVQTQPMGVGNGLGLPQSPCFSAGPGSAPPYPTGKGRGRLRLRPQ